MLKNSLSTLVKKHGSHGLVYIVVASLLLIANVDCFAQEEYNVISSWASFTDSQNSLYRYLSKQAFDLLQVREERVSRLNSLEEWKGWQEEKQKVFNESLGFNMERTPLNAKTTRVVTKDKYRVEHIIYESIPGFYVTASLYIPNGMKKRDKAPAIIYCSGHSDLGYRSENYQHLIINLVYKGFIVFAFDPIGQGERQQYFDKVEGKSLFGSTHEHSYPGSQMLIAGSSIAKYMIWDGIRAVDFLLTRREVDPSRIGITGRSGGGTQTALIAAADDRIYAAAPENYITTFRRLLQDRGPQDAEQVLFKPIANGLDQADLLIMRAPKPALMITTSNDIFNIQGGIEAEQEVAKVYGAYQKSDYFSRVEDVAGHASTLKNREALYAFFQRHLNNPGDAKDLDDIQTLSAEELVVSESGQIYTSLDGESIFSLANALKETTSQHDDDVLVWAKDLSGYRPPKEMQRPVYVGKTVKDKYVMTKHFIDGEGGYPIPYLLFTPAKPSGKYLIHISPAGKGDPSLLEEELLPFIDAGITVLSADLIGYGEMGPGTYRGDAYIQGTSHNLWYLSMMIGRSVAGIRAADLVALSQVVRQGDEDAIIIGYAKGECSPILLHAAAFSGNFDRIILVKPYSSYSAIVAEKRYLSSFITNVVPAALTKYDLPELALTLSPRPMMIIEAVDGSGQKNNNEQIDNDLKTIQEGYVGERLFISNDYSINTICNWLNKN